MAWAMSKQDGVVCMRESEMVALARSAWAIDAEPIVLSVDYEGTVMERGFFRIELSGGTALVDSVTGSIYAPQKLVCASNTRLTIDLLPLVPVLERVDKLPAAEEKKFQKWYRKKANEIEAETA